MATCRWVEKVEQWFDGDRRDDAAINDHLASCGLCRSHIARLETLRAGIGAIAQHHTIQDAQLPAFMAGIREGVEQAQPRRGGLWASLSLGLAALVVSISAYVMFPTGSSQVVATVESAETELVGGEVHVDVSGGTTTVWVEVNEHRDIQ